MKNYINRNKLLFLLSLGILIELVLILGLYVSYCNTRLAFNQIRYSTSNTANNVLNNVHWSFWDFLWKSGYSMSTYGNVSRLQGYQDSSIADIITKFFVTDESTTAKFTNSTYLITLFRSFNLNLQLSVAFIYSIGFFSILNLLFISYSIWKYILLSDVFNFYRLFLVILLSIWGFWITYEWEKSLISKNSSFLTKKIKWLNNIGALKAALRLRYLNNELIDGSDILIETKDLCFAPTIKKWFKNDVLTTPNYILKNINLKVKRGSFNVIIGPNGSGKTTLIKSLIRVNENVEGEVLWNGKDISKINRTEFARQVSYIPQFLNIAHSISIIDFLCFARFPYRQLMGSTIEKDREIVFKALETSGCEEFTNKMIDELSGGQRQKILLTSVLVQESEIIVLDEPTSFLDIKNQHQFLEQLKEFHRKGKTIIMILHDLQQSINYAENLIVMKDGEIKASGAPSKVVTKKLLRDTFKIDCDISVVNGKPQIENIYALN